MQYSKTFSSSRSSLELGSDNLPLPPTSQAYPVLHWPTFWGRYVRGEYESKPVLFATLHLVLAIAATMRAALGDEQLAARFFARAQLSGTECTVSYLFHPVRASCRY